MLTFNFIFKLRFLWVGGYRELLQLENGPPWGVSVSPGNRIGLVLVAALKVSCEEKNRAKKQKKP